MRQFLDHIGRTIEVVNHPMRIISLVPSQTELLFDLELNERVIGITKFCVHPDMWFRTKQRVGGTKNVNIELIKELQPDLVLANKEENVAAQIAAIQEFCPVWVSDINNLGSSLDLIKCIGELTNTGYYAVDILAEIARRFAKINPKHLPVKTCYLIWRNPYMTVGSDTFIRDMLSRINRQNVFDHLQRYPTIRLEDIQHANPEEILLSSEPYPFKEEHIAELQAACPNANIRLVDGEMFSWYGSRLLKAADYLKANFT